MFTERENKLASLAKKMNWLSPDQWQQCQDLRQITDPPLPLRKILLELQFVTEDQLAKLDQMLGSSSSQSSTSSVPSVEDTPPPPPPQKSLLDDISLADDGAQLFAAAMASVGQTPLPEDDPTSPAERERQMVGLALQLGWLQPEQLNQCFELRKITDHPLPLDKMLVELQFLTKSQVHELENRLKPSPPPSNSHLPALTPTPTPTPPPATPTPPPREANRSEGNQLKLPPTDEDATIGDYSLSDTNWDDGDATLDDDVTVDDFVPSEDGNVTVGDSLDGSTRKVENDLSFSELQPVNHNPEPKIKEFGRFKIIKTLGQGGMGMVFLAKDPMLDRVVALKTLFERTKMNMTAKQRFVNEAKSAGKLQHPNIVPIRDVSEHQGRLYLVMDYIAGISFKDVMADKKMSLEQRLRIMVKVAEAVHFAHKQGIIHRDLKPSNIQINGEGRPFVMDFGLAKDVTSDSSLTKTGATIGTPSYMPPEQAKGYLAQVDHRSDIYSLGAIIYEAVTGVKPFDGPTPVTIIYKVIKESLVPPRKHLSDIPRKLERIILQAMAPEKEDRYQTAGDLSEALKAYLEARPIPNIKRSGVGVVPRASRPEPTNNSDSTTMMAVGAFLVFLFGLWLVFSSPSQTSSRTTNKDRETSKDSDNTSVNDFAMSQDVKEKLQKKRGLLERQITQGKLVEAQKTLEELAGYKQQMGGATRTNFSQWYQKLKQRWTRELERQVEKTRRGARALLAMVPSPVSGGEKEIKELSKQVTEREREWKRISGELPSYREKTRELEEVWKQYGRLITAYREKKYGQVAALVHKIDVGGNASSQLMAYLENFQKKEVEKVVKEVVRLGGEGKFWQAAKKVRQFRQRHPRLLVDKDRSTFEILEYAVISATGVGNKVAKKIAGKVGEKVRIYPGGKYKLDDYKLVRVDYDNYKAPHLVFRITSRQVRSKHIVGAIFTRFMVKYVLSFDSSTKVRMAYWFYLTGTSNLRKKRFKTYFAGLTSSEKSDVVNLEVGPLAEMRDFYIKGLSSHVPVRVVKRTPDPKKNPDQKNPPRQPDKGATKGELDWNNLPIPSGGEWSQVLDQWGGKLIEFVRGKFEKYSTGNWKVLLKEAHDVYQKVKVWRDRLKSTGRKVPSRLNDGLVAVQTWFVFMGMSTSFTDTKALLKMSLDINLKGQRILEKNANEAQRVFDSKWEKEAKALKEIMNMESRRCHRDFRYNFEKWYRSFQSKYKSTTIFKRSHKAVELRSQVYHLVVNDRKARYSSREMVNLIYFWAKTHKKKETQLGKILGLILVRRIIINALAQKKYHPTIGSPLQWEQLPLKKMSFYSRLKRKDSKLADNVERLWPRLMKWTQLKYPKGFTYLTNDLLALARLTEVGKYLSGKSRRDRKVGLHLLGLYHYFKVVEKDDLFLKILSRDHTVKQQIREVYKEHRKKGTSLSDFRLTHIVPGQKGMLFMGPGFLIYQGFLHQVYTKINTPKRFLQVSLGSWKFFKAGLVFNNKGIFDLRLDHRYAVRIEKKKNGYVTLLLNNGRKIKSTYTIMGKSSAISQLRISFELSFQQPGKMMVVVGGKLVGAFPAPPAKTRGMRSIRCTMYKVEWESLQQHFTYDRPDVRVFIEQVMRDMR